MIPVFAFAGMLTLAVPIAAALALSAVLLIVLRGDMILFASLPQQFVAGIESYGLLALPLFILLGEAMNAGGSGRRLIALAGLLVGPVRGGLAYVSLIANVMLAAILGSTVAQLTVMSRMAVPQMVRAGYPRADAVALTAAGAMLAPVIPPSMLFILYGVIAQVPIGDLFVAGLVPGALMGLAFFGVIYWRSRRVPWPGGATDGAASGEVEAAYLGNNERARVLREALPALLIPLFVVVSILCGFATPTEAGGLAALLALGLGLFVHREITLSDLPGLFTRAALGAAVVLFLVACAQLLAWVLAYAGIPAQLGSWLSASTENPLVFLLLLNLLLLGVGMVMDPIPALLLTVPVLLPLGTGQYGLDPVHLGLVICMNLSLGLLTPPVGAGLFAAASLSGEPAGRIAARLMPFLAAAFAVLIAVSIWPLLTI
ncbi:TRAP transporter large permease [Alloyangia pacifica]|uniref:TRAP transporter large permease n=1 Tax=Alloyangia pacifica TaxID=311180 RepID=UPI001CD3878F|nr:TRAP transporter large permease [Alloyangia pacifica]MCA0998481.1 TRAP transporter large permease [Alloyangia pacifica]